MICRKYLFSKDIWLVNNEEKIIIINISKPTEIFENITDNTILIFFRLTFVNFEIYIVLL